MSDHFPAEPSSRDQLMQGLGRLEGTVGGIAREVTELRANAVTKEYLEAKVGDTNKFVRGFIALVLTIVAIAVLGSVIASRHAPTPTIPKIEIIVPTAAPARTP